MVSTLVRVHHAEYTEDIPFWIKQTEGLDPVLEIGCGFGRVTIPLAKAGRELVGIDLDQFSLDYFLSVLAELDDDIRRRVSLIQSDIIDYQPEIQFGAVIIPCNTYPTFHPQDRIRLLNQIHGFLRNDGVLIISMPNPHQMDQIHINLLEKNEIESPDQEAAFNHPETGYPVQVSSLVRATTESLIWDWIYDHLQPDGRVERSVVTVEHFLVSLDEILSDLDQAYFQNIRLLGDFLAEPYCDESPYLILICQK
jgi:SAM-dependent methyltransferase